MSEKISLEAVLPIAAQVFNALPDNARPDVAPSLPKDVVTRQFAEAFAEFALTIHRKLNSDT